MEGVRAFLASRGISLPEGAPEDAAGAETVHGLANRKNEVLRGRLEARGVTAYEGSNTYLQTALEADVHTAVVSASANTPLRSSNAPMRRARHGCGRSTPIRNSITSGKIGAICTSARS